MQSYSDDAEVNEYAGGGTQYPMSKPRDIQREMAVI